MPKSKKGKKLGGLSGGIGAGMMMDKQAAESIKNFENKIEEVRKGLMLEINRLEAKIEHQENDDSKLDEVQKKLDSHIEWNRKEFDINEKI